jgi:acetyl esterase/lipase
MLIAIRLDAQAPVTVGYADNGTPDQVMDIHWPSSQPTATILFIHGGSLQESGERRTSREYRDVCTQFVKSGIACASMDYRLAPSHRWPAMPNDVATFGTAENYLAANPASFVGRHVPPTLVIVADSERFMPALLEQGSRFVRLLLENEVPANLMIVPGTHMSSIAAVARAGDPTLLAILQFMKDPRAIEAAH